MKRYICALWLCCSGGYGGAGELAQLYTQLLEVDPKLRGSALLIEREQARRTQVLGQMDWNASLSGSATHFVQEARNQHRDYGGERLTLNAEQPLLRPRQQTQTARADAQLAQVRQEHAATTSTAVERLAVLYVQWLGSVADVALKYSQVQSIEIRQLQEQALLQRQLTTLPEQLNAQARLDLVKAQLIEAQITQQVARSDLRALLGGALPPLSGPGLPVLAAKSYLFSGQAPRAALDIAEHPQYQSLLSAIRVAQLARDEQDRRDWPELSLRLQAQQSNVNSDYLWQEHVATYSAGVDLNWALYSGRRDQGALREQQVNIEINVQQLEALQNEIKANVARYSQQFSAHYSSWMAAQNALNSARVALQAAQEGRRLNAVTEADKALAEHALTQAQYEVATAALAGLSAWVRWQGAQGRADAALVAQIDTWLSAGG